MTNEIKQVLYQNLSNSRVNDITTRTLQIVGKNHKKIFNDPSAMLNLIRNSCPATILLVAISLTQTLSTAYGNGKINVP